MCSSTPPAWTLLSQREVLDGQPWLRVFKDTLRLPTGHEIEGFYRVWMPDYAVIFATVGERVLVQRSYKHGPGRVGLHLPAGYLESGEEPLAAAQRELLEETGYVSDSWAPLGTFTNDGNRGAGAAHIFRASHARQTNNPRSDDLEETETMLLSKSDLQQALRRGDVPVISVAATIALAALDERQNSDSS
jgi:ADP-ribose pyrophosphatase